MAEPEDGASRAGLQVHPPPGRPVGRPRGAGGRGRPLVPAPASPRPGARYREPLKKGPDDAGKGERDCTETVYLITSLDAGAASPEELLRLNRGHWAVESLNRRHRDRVCGEDACPICTGNGPGEPGQPRQRRARGDLRRPPRGHRRPDPALRRQGVRDPPEGRQTSRTNHRGRKRCRRWRVGGPAATDSGRNMPIPPPSAGLPQDQPRRGNVLSGLFGEAAQCSKKS